MSCRQISLNQQQNFAARSLRLPSASSIVCFDSSRKPRDFERIEGAGCKSAATYLVALIGQKVRVRAGKCCVKLLGAA